MTRFVGTFPNSSPQMKKAYILGKHMVDLYYNDLWGLKQLFDILLSKIGHKVKKKPAADFKE